MCGQHSSVGSVFFGAFYYRTPGIVLIIFFCYWRERQDHQKTIRATIIHCMLTKFHWATNTLVVRVVSRRTLSDELADGAERGDCEHSLVTYCGLNIETVHGVQRQLLAFWSKNISVTHWNNTRGVPGISITWREEPPTFWERMSRESTLLLYSSSSACLAKETASHV